MSETACGRFAGLRGMPATTESVMSTALIQSNTANNTFEKKLLQRVTLRNKRILDAFFVGSLIILCRFFVSYFELT